MSDAQCAMPKPVSHNARCNLKSKIKKSDSEESGVRFIIFEISFFLVYINFEIVRFIWATISY